MLTWLAIGWALCSAYVAGLWTVVWIRDAKDWPENVCGPDADDILFFVIVTAASVIASPLSIVVFVATSIYDSREP